MNRHVAVLLVLVLGVAAQAAAQVRLEGRVRSADGTPIAGATVRVRGLDIEPASTTTDPTGRYVFPEIKGTWIVLVAWSAGRPVAEAAALVTLPRETIDLTARTGLATLSSVMDLDPMEGPAGVLSGTVRSANGTAIPGARVAIRYTLISTTTDAFGRYDLGRIRAGLEITLQVSAAGYVSADRTVEVVSEARTATDFVVNPQPMRGAGTTLAAAQVPLGSDELRIDAPSVGGLAAPGRADVIRALQLLPGVGGSLEDPSGFVVRGGTADQTTTTYEGMTLYPFSGLRGMFGGFNPAAIHRVDLARTSFGASGASEIRLVGAGDSIEQRPSGYLEASAFGAGGRVVVPLAGRGSILIAARQNPPDRLYANVLDKYSNGQGLFVPDRAPAFSGGSLGTSPTPRFHDLNTTIDVRPTSADRVSVSYYDARDAANLSRNVTVPATSILGVPNSDRLPAESVVEVSDVYDWTGQGASASWRRQWSPRVKSSLSFAQTTFEKRDARAFVLRDAVTGENYSFLDNAGSDALSNSNRVEHSSVRFETGVDLGMEHGVTIGGEIADLDFAYTGLVERPVGSSTSQTAMVPSGSRAATGGLMRLYAEDLWRPTSKLTFNLGARITRFDLDAGVRVEPLVGATYSWMPDVQFVGAWSVSHQPATRITREDRLHGDTEYWALADGASVRMPRVEQWSGGARLNRFGLLVDASMFYKRFDNLTMLGATHTSIVAEPVVEPSLHSGKGKAAGVGFLVQSQTRLNDVWASYSGGRTVQSFPTLEAGTFVASNDRTHEFKVGDTWRVAGPWSVSGTFVAASGLPATSVSRKLVWLDGAEQVYRTDFGAKNTTRLPAYHRLDVSSQVVIDLKGPTLTLGAIVFNAYDRSNVRYRTYEIAGSTVAGDDMTFIGRAFNVFARVGF